jgi:rhodanese-related sulfurtransferase
MLTKLISSNRKKFLFLTFLLLLVVLVVGCSSQSIGPEIELSETFYDLGDVNPDDGLRIEEFLVKNKGSETLEILAVSTSCGCTDAEVDKESLAPDEEAKLTVTYDPSIHPGLVGKMERVVYIKSNDPVNEEVELTLIGESLPSSNVDIEKGTKPHEDNLKDFEISPFDFNSKIENKENVKLVDVREDFEFNEGHIEGSINLPVGEITEASLLELNLNKDDEILLYCRSGRRSAQAYEIMKEMGYSNIKSMNGGILHWVEEGFETEMEEEHGH